MDASSRVIRNEIYYDCKIELFDLLPLIKGELDKFFLPLNQISLIGFIGPYKCLYYYWNLFDNFL